MKAVVIVGGGPVGLALSPVLVRCGASALIPGVREAPNPRDEPQTLTWNQVDDVRTGTPTRPTREREEMMTVTQSVPGHLSGRRARWTVDTDDLEICFSVGLMKVATVQGHFGKAEGTIMLDDSAPHWSRVDLSIEASSIDTRNPVRDYHLQTRDYLDAGRFPYIAFASSHVVPRDDTTSQVTGNLTIRGVTREICLDVAHDEDTVELGARRRRFSAEARIDRKDFGIDPGIVGLGFLIGSEVTVRVRGEAIERPRGGVDLREESYEKP